MLTGTLHEDLCTVMLISRCILRKVIDVSDKVVEKIKIHTLCSITLS